MLGPRAPLLLTRSDEPAASGAKNPSCSVDPGRDMAHNASALRYLRVTLLVGLIVSLGGIALLELGVIGYFDRLLCQVAGLPVPAGRGSVWAHYLPVVFLAFGGAWVAIDIARMELKLVIAGLALVEIVTLFWVMREYRIFFSPFGPALALLLSSVAGIAFSRSEIGQRKRLLRAVFGERISRKTLYALLNSKAPINLAGELREASVVSVEFFNHDDLLDVLPVNECVTMTNRFLESVSDFLVERGGCLDECSGESVLVIFGAPLADDGHAASACHAALDLIRHLDALNKEFVERWQRTIDFRVGVNSGEMITATYGSRRMGSFSAAGEPVEFARRLCIANRIYGSRILIGAETFQLASDDVEVRPMELLRARDARSREEIYELLARKDGLTEDERQRRDAFWKGIVFYREQLWDEAVAAFREASPKSGFDTPVHFYSRRVEHLRSGLAMQALEDEKF
jgi:adenylate cyclase